MKAIGEDEVFRVIKTGKRKRKIYPSSSSVSLIVNTTGNAWKRMVTKVTYVGEGFTRKPPKYERFIRPMVNNDYITHTCSL